MGAVGVMQGQHSLDSAKNSRKALSGGNFVHPEFMIIGAITCGIVIET